MTQVEITEQTSTVQVIEQGFEVAVSPDDTVEVTLVEQTTPVTVTSEPVITVQIEQEQPPNVQVVVEPSPIVVEVGVPGPAGSQRLFVQPTNPGLTGPGLWVQTDIGPNNDWTMWIEDGTP